MSQQTQQHPQQNQGAKPEPKWAPDQHTVFLIQTDESFERRAREHVERTMPRPFNSRMGVRLNTASVRPDTEIVVVYFDPNADIWDPTLPAADGNGKGAWRERDRGVRRKGEWERKPEAPAIQMSKPVSCSDLWSEPDYDADGGNMGIGGVRLNNRKDEDGRMVTGLISRLTSACFAKNARGRDRAVVRVAHRPEEGNQYIYVVAA